MATCPPHRRSSYHGTRRHHTRELSELAAVGARSVATLMQTGGAARGFMPPPPAFSQQPSFAQPPAYTRMASRLPENDAPNVADAPVAWWKMQLERELREEARQQGGRRHRRHRSEDRRHHRSRR